MKTMAQFNLNSVHKRGLKHHHFISVYEDLLLYGIKRSFLENYSCEWNGKIQKGNG